VCPVLSGAPWAFTFLKGSSLRGREWYLLMFCVLLYDVYPLDGAHPIFNHLGPLSIGIYICGLNSGGRGGATMCRVFSPGWMPCLFSHDRRNHGTRILKEDGASFCCRRGTCLHLATSLLCRQSLCLLNREGRKREGMKHSGLL
jgi:hypothetical protein